MLVRIVIPVHLPTGEVQFYTRSFRAPAQGVPSGYIEAAGLTMKITNRDCVEGPGTLRLLTEPLKGDQSARMTEHGYTKFPAGAPQ